VPAFATANDDRRNPGAGISGPAFVGRERELATLRQALSRPATIALVEGEAGVGKSRLVRELLASAALGRPRTAVAVCPPYLESLTLGPVVDALRLATDDVRGLRLSPLAGSLRPVFPEWVDELPPSPEPMADAAAARHRLFQAFAEARAGQRRCSPPDACSPNAAAVDTTFMTMASLGFSRPMKDTVSRTKDATPAARRLRGGAELCGQALLPALVRTAVARLPGVVRRVAVAAFFVPVPRFASLAGRAGVTFVGALRAVVVFAAVVLFAVLVLAAVVRLATAFFAGTVLAAAVFRAVVFFATARLGGAAALAAVVFFAAGAPVALRLVPPTAATVFFAAARGAAGFFVGCFATAIVSVSSREGSRHRARAGVARRVLSSVSTRLWSQAPVAPGWWARCYS
jgi:AAA ATPase domain